MDIGVWDIIAALIGGTIIGILGKWLAPGGRDNIPLWLTVLCGIGGIFLGTMAYTQFFDATSSGVDWWRHIWQIVVAAVLVVIAAGITGRKRT